MLDLTKVSYFICPAIPQQLILCKDRAFLSASGVERARDSAMFSRVAHSNALHRNIVRMKIAG